jgi:hypothetical protein
MRIRLGVRKIQLISGSSFISLPKTWIKACDLQKGDRVSLVLREDGIMEIEALKEMNELD